MAAVAHSVPSGRSAVIAATAVAGSPDSRGTRVSAAAEIWTAASTAAAHAVTGVVIGTGF